MIFGFHSLRRRLIAPLLAAAIVAAIVVAFAAYWLAAVSSQTEARNRFASIRKVVEDSSFPLTHNVLTMLSHLSSADWYTLDSTGAVRESSAGASALESTSALFRPLGELPQAEEDSAPSNVELNGRIYQAMRFSRGIGRGAVQGQTQDVVVMFDDSQRRNSLYRAAVTPLVTGLSTVFLLTSIVWLITERLIQRISRLQLEVERIAQGDFNRSIQTGQSRGSPREPTLIRGANHDNSIGPQDELGLLSKSVGSMAEQLSQMWQALRQNHGQQLLHQISGGLAHNLRNTLTGARMAVELVQRQLSTGQSRTTALPSSSSSTESSLKVAVSQLEQAEEYVQRLLLASRGQETAGRPATVLGSLEGLRPGLDSIAEHRGVELQWRFDQALQDHRVADAPTLLAAVSNLVWNAMEAGSRVEVDVELAEPNRCVVRVSDNGPGPGAEVEKNLFEPFVSSKPEGIGLGLPVVKRAAETLRGEVQWSREGNLTVFRFAFPVFDEEPKE
jgi:signal transduction histidine kinase